MTLLTLLSSLETCWNAFRSALWAISSSRSFCSIKQGLVIRQHTHTFHAEMMHKVPLTHTTHTHRSHISSNLSVFLEPLLEFLYVGLLQLIFLHTPCPLCSCLLFRWLAMVLLTGSMLLILLLIVNIPLLLVLWLVILKLLGGGDWSGHWQCWRCWAAYIWPVCSSVCCSDWPGLVLLMFLLLLQLLKLLLMTLLSAAFVPLQIHKMWVYIHTYIHLNMSMTFPYYSNCFMVLLNFHCA